MLQDSINKALSKLRREENDIQKGSMDAMSHHAMHARAAQMANKEDVAKRHIFMFMRHALENARDVKDSYAMIDSLQNSLSYFARDASSKVSWKESELASDPTYGHYKAGGDYIPSEDDSFAEDYEDSDGPDIEKAMADKCEDKSDDASSGMKLKGMLAKIKDKKKGKGKDKDKKKKRSFVFGKK